MSKELTKGITLLALGQKKFIQFAYQMAVSIKYHNPDLPIQLIAGAEVINGAPMHHFDHVTIIDPSDYTTNHRIDPGKAKVSIYPYLKFDRTIYLDVDGFCINSLEALFELCEGKEYACQADAMHWAKPDTLREQYDLNGEVYGLNSSFQYIVKGETCEKIFTHALDAMINNPVSAADMTNNWYNRAPDELYLSVGMAKVNLPSPYLEENKYPIYFRQRHKYGAAVKFEQLQQDYFLIGSYGSDRFNHVSIAKHYNRYVNKYCIAVDGRNIMWKLEHLMQDKANSRIPKVKAV